MVALIGLGMLVAVVWLLAYGMDSGSETPVMGHSNKHATSSASIQAKTKRAA